jgi:hypothetical protein
MPADTNSSLKERVEQTIANLLSANATLDLLIPRKQNEQDKPQRPFIAIVATPGKEIVPRCGVFRVPTAIEFNFDSKKSGQTDVDLDVAVALAEDQLEIGQALGSYGLVREGETQSFEGETGRKRVLNLTLFCS